ncbi:MAG: hypothetical protein Q9170_003795 [Blastenia crenularia]
MDSLQHLEELTLAVKHRFYAEPTPGILGPWQSLFGYSASEAREFIVRHRASVNVPRLPDQQWSLIKTTKRVEGYDRSQYEHQLQLWSARSHSHVGPRAAAETSSTSSYVFKLGGPFTDVEDLQRLVRVSSVEARVGYGDDGRAASFACVDASTKRVIEEWLESQSPPVSYRPTFIGVSQTPGNVSDVSCYPELGIDSTFLQHKIQDVGPAQMAYPRWYFFYGTLTNLQILQNSLSLPYLPTLIPAFIKRGRLRSWRRKYKALVDGPADAEVDGYACLVESFDQEDCLRFREKADYEVVQCHISFHGGRVKEVVQGLTFRFRDPGRLDADQGDYFVWKQRK